MDEYCRENGFASWFETSARDNINIDEAAKALVEKVRFVIKLLNIFYNFYNGRPITYGILRYFTFFNMYMITEGPCLFHIMEIEFHNIISIIQYQVFTCDLVHVRDILINNYTRRPNDD